MSITVDGNVANSQQLAALRSDLNGLGLTAVALGGAAKANSDLRIRFNKLLRAAAETEYSNMITTPPWLDVVSTYQPNTAYVAGQVIRASDQRLYMVGVSGTSPATGGEPAIAGSDARYTIFGGSGPSWTLLENDLTPDTGGGAPVVSVTTVPISAGINWYPQQYPDRFTLSGGYPLNYASSFWEIRAFKRNDTFEEGLTPTVSFYSAADRLQLRSLVNKSTRIFVDGRLLRHEPFRPLDSTPNNFVTIDWRGAGPGRRERRYDVDIQAVAGGAHFGGITMADGTHPRPAPKGPKVAWISDSLGAGALAPQLVGGSLPNQVCRRLGWTDVWNMSVGGSGWITRGVNDAYPFRQRISQAVAIAPDVIIIHGSPNDPEANGAEVTVAVAGAISDARNLGYLGPIIIIGVVPVAATAVSKELAVLAGIQQAADPLVWFVPMATATIPTVIGSWNSTKTPNAQENRFIFMADAVHPPEMGNHEYAGWLNQEIRRIVLPDWQRYT